MEVVKKWELFVSGDNEAYSWIYEAFVQNLYHYGLCFTQDSDLIKDCIQDLFASIYFNRKKLDKVRNVKTYLLISLKNNLCRELLKEKDSLQIQNEDYTFLAEKTVEELFIENESREIELNQVKSILQSLTSRQREIIYYRFIQELSMPDICNIMNLNYQSAQNLIQRALKKLRETYSGEITLLFCSIFPYSQVFLK